jgi:hypothetical protein
MTVSQFFWIIVAIALGILLSDFIKYLIQVFN